MTEVWQTKARCRNGDEMQPDRATTAEVADLLMVCEGCPVRRQCRELAESQASPYGVHDGLWWGEHPVWESVRTCAHEPCGESFRAPVDGRGAADYCSPRCRVAAYRARSAGTLSA